MGSKDCCSYHCNTSYSKHNTPDSDTDSNTVWAAAGLRQQSRPEEAVPGNTAGDHAARPCQEDGQQVDNRRSQTRLQSQLESFQMAKCVSCLQELQQFEQDIFADYSSFILTHNVYDDILRSILSKEIETGTMWNTSLIIWEMPV